MVIYFKTNPFLAIALTIIERILILISKEKECEE